MATFEIINKKDMPKSTRRKVFADIRIEVDRKLRNLEDNQVLTVSNYPYNVINALRRWYQKHGYPNTFMRKGKLYISK